MLWPLTRGSHLLNYMLRSLTRGALFYTTCYGRSRQVPFYYTTFPFTKDIGFGIHRMFVTDNSFT